MGLFDGLLKLVAGLSAPKQAPSAPQQAAPSPILGPTTHPQPKPAAAPVLTKMKTGYAISPAQLIAMGATRARAEAFAGPINAACVLFGINTPARVRMFIAQTFAETANLNLLKENLSYTAKNLMDTWPTRYTSLESTMGYVHNPLALAERQYGGKNGNKAFGDGLRYSGRGMMQLTFKGNYAECAAATGLDCVKHPEILETPEGAALSAAWFFSSRGCNEISDADDEGAVRLATKKINGGQNGIDKRLKNWKRAKGVF